MVVAKRSHKGTKFVLHIKLKGFKMSYSQDKELLSYAMKMGCKTAAEFALFLKARASILAL